LGAIPEQTDKGGRKAGDAKPANHPSLEEVHSTVPVPHSRAGFWAQWRAFVGPAILISVGYMDPGNWGTDLAGGARFKYGLLWVVAVASFMAVILQVISARLGVATGKDLAQCCRDFYPYWMRWPNWISMEIAIGATDLAESLGSAVALNLLFHIPMAWAIIITAFDVLLLLAFQGLGMRLIEAVIAVFVLTIGVCYGIEIFGLAQTQPDFLEMGQALIQPGIHQTGMIVVAIGIIGATVMPHNLYLHSALVQTRKVERDDHSIRNAIRFNTIDSSVALTIAFFVNAAILVLAAMVFYGKQSVTVADGQTVVQPRQRLDTHCLSDAGPTVGHDGRQHSFCSGLAGQRAKQHHHRHAGRAGGDGRFHALASPPVDQADDLAIARRGAGHLDHLHSRQWQHNQSGQPQPGDSLSHPAVCHVSAVAIHLVAKGHGPMVQRLVFADPGLGQRDIDYCDGHL